MRIIYLDLVVYKAGDSKKASFGADVPNLAYFCPAKLSRTKSEAIRACCKQAILELCDKYFRPGEIESWKPLQRETLLKLVSRKRWIAWGSELRMLSEEERTFRTMLHKNRRIKVIFRCWEWRMGRSTPLDLLFLVRHLSTTVPSNYIHMSQLPTL